MKKLKRINLQMFADEPELEDSEDPAKQKETKSTEEKNEKEVSKDPKVKYSDDDVDKIINQKFAEWEKKHQKEVDEAKKLADMNAAEKADYETKKLRKELDEMKQKDTLSEMTKTARKMLSEKEIIVSDELLGVLVTTDAEETKSAVDGFISLFTDAVEKSVKEALKGKTPTRKTVPGITKEQIMAIKNPAERKQAIAENIEIFD